MEFSPFDTRGYPLLPAQTGYQEWAETYETSVVNLMDLKLLDRIKSLNWEKINTAIDLACGTGRIGIWLKGKGVKSIDGIDFASKMLEKAKDKGVYRQLLNGNMVETNFKNESYELSIEVLADEHISDLDPLYTEASRISKAGGYFVILGYHPFFLMNGLITHFHREDGTPIGIESYIHLLSDHVKAASKVNLKLVEMDEGIIDNDWLVVKPKWIRFKNWPVSFVMVWEKCESIIQKKGLRL